MATSFKSSHACTAALSAPSPAAGHRRPTPPLETLDTHGQAWLSLLCGHCSFLMGPGVSGEGWCRAEEPKPRGSLQGLLAFLAYQRYKAGVDEFIQNYVDPTPDPSTAYASYPGMPADTYQQPPFTQNAESTEGYQPPPVY